MIHEIQQTLWVNTPHGVGQALFIIDYGPHHNSIWIVANKKDGKIMHYDTKQISIERNNTYEMNLENN